MRPARGPGTGPGAAGIVRRRPAQGRALHHRQQDVRLGHEDRDDGHGLAACRRGIGRRGRRHGEHDQRTLRRAQDAQRCTTGDFTAVE